MSLNPAEIGIGSNAPRPAVPAHHAPPSDQFAKSLTKAARAHSHKTPLAKAPSKQVVADSGTAKPSVSAQTAKAAAATENAPNRFQPPVNGKPNVAQGKTSSGHPNVAAQPAASRQAASTGQPAAPVTDTEDSAIVEADPSEPPEAAGLPPPAPNPEPAAPPALNGAPVAAGDAAAQTEHLAAGESEASAEPAGPVALSLASAAPGTETKSAADVAIDPGLAPKATAAPAETATPVPVAAPTTSIAAPVTPHQATEAAAQPDTAPPAPPTVQVGVSLLRSALGLDQQVFTLSLRPERLGGVDVRLEVDRQGRARATFSAEKSDTLQILRQDAHHLVNTLKQAGLDADASSISFSLKDPDQGKSSFGQDRDTSSRARPNRASTDEDHAEAVAVPAIASNRLYDIKA